MGVRRRERAGRREREGGRARKTSGWEGNKFSNVLHIVTLYIVNILES
jgi:hypothetical protein